MELEEVTWGCGGWKGLCQVCKGSCVIWNGLCRFVGVIWCWETDPAHRIVSVIDNPLWRRPTQPPRGSWVKQADTSCWEVLKIKRGPEWRLARRDPGVWRRRVGEKTFSSDVCPH